MNDNKELARVEETQAPVKTEELSVVTPRSDIWEKADGFMLVADMPGVAEKSVEIHLEHNELRISGTTSHEHLTDYELAYSEYRPSSFRRIFRISDEVDAEKISAHMKDGVLRVHLPKRDALKPRKIEVRSA